MRQDLGQEVLGAVGLGVVKELLGRLLLEDLAVGLVKKFGEATAVDDAVDMLGDSVSVYLDGGASPTGVASTIVDATGARIAEPGAFELLIGSSSRDEDLRSVSFTVAAA